MKNVLAVCLGLLRMSSTVASAEKAPAGPVLRVGSSLNDSNAEAFYATEMGFFKQAGLNVEMHVQ